MIPLRLTFTSMILFWLALSFSAYGNINIRVVEATGSPLMLPPFHGHWIPLDIGMRLYQGTLVQVRENESLLLRWNKNDRNTPQQIEIDFPFMFRISEEMYRDIEIVIREIKDYKDLLNKTKNPNKKKEKTNFYDISSAWEWGLFKENIKVEKAAAEEDKWFKMQFDELLRQEDNNSPDPVIRPLENEIIQADGFPSEVSVTLSENLDQFPYEVYVWRKIDGSTPPKTPLVLTDSRYFSLPTFEQGEYYMTLLGRDQNFTKLRSFSVADKTLTPIDIRNTTIRVIEKLKQPIDQSKWLITSDEKRAKIPFSLGSYFLFTGSA